MNKGFKADAVRDACEAAGISVEQACTHDRTEYVFVRRWRVMETLRGRGWSLHQIGDALGHDHTTVHTGLTRLAKLRAALND